MTTIITSERHSLRVAPCFKQRPCVRALTLKTWPPPTQPYHHLPLNNKTTPHMLLQFPSEILIAIFSHLDDSKDLQAVRLVNRCVSTLVRSRFLDHFFGTSTINLSKRNVEQLQTLAASQDCRDAVRTLMFWTSSRRFGSGLSWPRNNDLKLQETPTLQAIRSLLTDSFPRCQTLHISSDENMSWSQCPDYWETTEYATFPDVLGQIFIALANAASTHHIESIALNLDSRWPRFCFDAVAPATYSSGAFWRAWSKIKRLKIHAEPPESIQGLRLLISLITRTRSLEKLSLSIVFHKTPLGEIPSVEHLISCQTQNLSHLVLRAAKFTSSDSFVAVLKKFRHTLRVLSLSGVRLRDENGWQKACVAMRGQFTSLNRFILIRPSLHSDTAKFNSIMQLMCPLRTTVAETTGDFDFIESHDRQWIRRYLVCGVRYVGPDLDSALELIERALYPDGSPPNDLEPYVLPKGRGPGRILAFDDPNVEF